MLSHVTVFALSTVLLLSAAFGAKQLDIHKGAIVHLLEWKWDDIARECEEFLAPRGYAAVQTSPPSENLVVKGRPWEERLQVVSYKLISRSGTEEQLISMLKRCNKVGVRVFALVVFNHMTQDTDNCVGVGGSKCNAIEMDYPAVPYTKEDFHPKRNITNYQDRKQIREGQEMGCHDLDQSRKNVQDRIVEFLNHLIAIGFSGFRIDAATNMEPKDLAEIYSRVNNLASDLGLPADTRPFIYQDVSDYGTQSSVISYDEYTPMGLVTNVAYHLRIHRVIQEKHNITLLRSIGAPVPDDSSVVYVDGYEFEKSVLNQLNYKTEQPYKIALVFMLAWGYGHPLILSSYKFEGGHDGPPADSNENILSPNPNEKNVCENGWVCQHRWRLVYSMVAFNNATHGTTLSMWYHNGNRQIAFSRGKKGFVAINLEQKPFKATSMPTMLPRGKYCDVISGGIVNGKCEGKIIKVDEEGYADIFIQAYDELDKEHVGVLAIFDHELSRLKEPLGGNVDVVIQ